MGGYHRSRSLAHGTPADVRLYSWGTDWHHWHRYVCSQPVAIVVPGSVVALVVYVAEQVRHGGETSQARA